ncbi:hypothetical protein DL93DRAFT_2091612, partial [Clavulina sp. PMI_390]
MDNLIADIVRNVEKLTESVKGHEGVGTDGFASSLPITEDLNYLHSTISLLDQASLGLDFVKSTLTHKIDVKRAVVARLHNSLQPILRLPSELLLEILELEAPNLHSTWFRTLSSATSFAGSDEWSDNEYDDFRRSFGATCTNFRSLLLSSTKAWSFVSLKVIRNDKTIPSQQWEQLLERSAPSPLHLKIEFDGSRPRKQFAEHSRILQQHLNRCHSILIGCQTWTFTFLDGFLDLSELANLKEFIFHGSSGFLRFQLPSVVSLLSSTWNKLETLAICSDRNEDDIAIGPSSEQFVQHISLAASLTRLRITAPYDTSSIISFLTECVKLQHLEWSSSERLPGASIIGPNVKPLHMPSLLTLSIPGETTLYFFPPINAPLLETICLGYDIELMIEDDLSVHPCAIFHPKQPHLSSLKRIMFDPAMYPSGSISNFLLSHHAIEEVYLDNVNASTIGAEQFTSLVDTLLALTTSLPDGRPLHTHLRRLRINLYGKKTASPEVYSVLRNTLVRVQDILGSVKIHALYNDKDVEDMFPHVHLVHIGNHHEFDETWPSPWSLCERMAMGLSQRWHSSETIAGDQSESGLLPPGKLSSDPHSGEGQVEPPVESRLL